MNCIPIDHLAENIDSSSRVIHVTPELMRQRITSFSKSHPSVISIYLHFGIQCATQDPLSPERNFYYQYHGVELWPCLCARIIYSFRYLWGPPCLFIMFVVPSKLDYGFGFLFVLFYGVINGVSRFVR